MRKELQELLESWNEGAGIVIEDGKYTREELDEFMNEINKSLVAERKVSLLYKEDTLSCWKSKNSKRNHP